jgi:hypothetical protein
MNTISRTSSILPRWQRSQGTIAGTERHAEG